jgi:hypothetical protein
MSQNSGKIKDAKRVVHVQVVADEEVVYLLMISQAWTIILSFI